MPTMLQITYSSVFNPSASPRGSASKEEAAAGTWCSASPATCRNRPTMSAVCTVLVTGADPDLLLARHSSFHRARDGWTCFSASGAVWAPSAPQPASREPLSAAASNCIEEPGFLVLAPLSLFFPFLRQDAKAALPASSDPLLPNTQVDVVMRAADVPSHVMTSAKQLGSPDALVALPAHVAGCFTVGELEGAFADLLDAVNGRRGGGSQVWTFGWSLAAGGADGAGGAPRLAASFAVLRVPLPAPAGVTATAAGVTASTPEGSGRAEERRAARDALAPQRYINRGTGSEAVQQWMQGGQPQDVTARAPPWVAAEEGAAAESQVWQLGCVLAALVDVDVDPVDTDLA